MVAMNVWPTDAADGSVATEARWRKMGRVWAPSGVVIGAGGDLAPSLAFPNLTVQAGAAWVDGHYCELPGAQVLPVTANGIVVVRFDPAANTAELLYRDGVTTPAQNPNGTWELLIASMAGSVMTDARASTDDVPRGIIKRVRTGGTTNVGSNVWTDVAGTLLSFQGIKDRWYRFTAMIGKYDTSGVAGVVAASFTDQAGAIKAGAYQSIGSPATGYFTIVNYELLLATGPVSRKVQMFTAASLIVAAGTVFIIEDMGRNPTA